MLSNSLISTATKQGAKYKTKENLGTHIWRFYLTITFFKYWNNLDTGPKQTMSFFTEDMVGLAIGLFALIIAIFIGIWFQ